jgi:hypothetical protein
MKDETQSFFGLTGPLAGFLADRAGYGSVFLIGAAAAAAGLLIALCLRSAQNLVPSYQSVSPEVAENSRPSGARDRGVDSAMEEPYFRCFSRTSALSPNATIEQTCHHVSNVPLSGHALGYRKVL